MKIFADCIPCFLSQSIEAARMVTNDVKVHEKVIKGVMQELQDISYEKTPPEISTLVHRKIKEITNCPDPYKKVKEIENSFAIKLEKKVKYWDELSDKSLQTSIKLAIAGNVIDFGTPTRIDIKDFLKELKNKEFAINDFKIFKDKLAESKNILYLGDNTGEIVFDKIMVEELIDRGKNVTFVVREKPIINDATLEDAKFVGLDTIVKVITGVKESPGTVLELCSEEFIKEFWAADMIIAKGQGNYEALSNENVNIFFFLIAKCKLVAKDLGVNIGDMIMKFGGKNGNNGSI